MIPIWRVFYLFKKICKTAATSFLLHLLAFDQHGAAARTCQSLPGLSCCAPASPCGNQLLFIHLNNAATEKIWFIENKPKIWQNVLWRVICGDWLKKTLLKPRLRKKMWEYYKYYIFWDRKTHPMSYMRHSSLILMKKMCLADLGS